MPQNPLNRANHSPEGIFEELCKLLPSVTAEELLHLGPDLAVLIPELQPMLSFDQRSPHHAYDLFQHTAHVVENVPADLTLRWAALLHDTGKVPTFTQDATGRGHFYGHAQESARMADAILRRLDAPDGFRERVVILIELHMTKIKPDAEHVQPILDRLGMEALELLLLLQEADMASKGVDEPNDFSQFPRIRSVALELLKET